MFDKQEAQNWWAENRENIMELYNVKRFNRGSFPVQTESQGSSKMESTENSPMTRPLARDSIQHNGMRTGCSSSDSLDTSSAMGASISTPSSFRNADVSVSTNDMGTEWVQQDEPGVYITVRALPGGRRELRRVRFRLVMSISLGLSDLLSNLKMRT